MRKEFKAIVRGHVQMVMYRDFAQRKAKRHHIVGTVKNLPDKTVEVVAQGEEKDLGDYIQKLHRGSLLSRVDGVEIEWQNNLQEFTRFDIVY